MLITTGTVHGGTIKVDAKSLPEGTIVTVLASEGTKPSSSFLRRRLSCSRLSRKPSEERRQARRRSWRD